MHTDIVKEHRHMKTLPVATALLIDASAPHES
jgi:hypothetical protein